MTPDKPKKTDIDPAREYRVRLAERIVLAPDWVLYPGQDVRMSGALLQQHYAAVLSAELLPDISAPQ